MSTPTVSDPFAINVAPTPSTSASAAEDKNWTNGKYSATRRCAAIRESRYELPSRWKCCCVAGSCAKACVSRTPDRLSWKSALTTAIRSRDRS